MCPLQGTPPVLTHWGREGGGGGQLLWRWLLGVGPHCFQMAQSRVGRHSGEGGKGILVAQGDTTPSLVSYLSCGCVCMRQPHSRCEAPSRGAGGIALCTKFLPAGHSHRQRGWGRPLPMPGYLILLYSIAHRGGPGDVPPCCSECQLIVTQISNDKLGHLATPH